MVGTIEMDDLDDMEVPQFMDTLNIIFTYIYMCVCRDFNIFSKYVYIEGAVCIDMLPVNGWTPNMDASPRGKLT